mmetsp:Transcript_48787/g.135768  ORF Transcript_48787/g.135768 Transcript_48787/m.135768 type:complete len:211 (+) Transcript_48787:2-634(+)
MRPRFHSRSHAMDLRNPMSALSMRHPPLQVAYMFPATAMSSRMRPHISVVPHCATFVKASLHGASSSSGSRRRASRRSSLRCRNRLSEDTAKSQRKRLWQAPLPTHCRDVASWPPGANNSTVRSSDFPVSHVNASHNVTPPSAKPTISQPPSITGGAAKYTASPADKKALMFERTSCFITGMFRRAKHGCPLPGSAACAPVFPNFSGKTR